jgi:hypothetical protein
VLESGAKYAGIIATVQEMFKTVDLRTLIPQLANQGYGLTMTNGLWQWYKPADSSPLVSLTVQQIAKQLQILGTLLERI